LAALVLACVYLALPLPASNAQRGAASAKATVAAGAAAPSASFAAARSAAERITAAKLKETLYVVASDEMAGRDTPSAGLDATAKYIADKLSNLKLKPAGDKNSYFQRIALRSTEVDREKTQAAMAERTFKAGEDFLPAGRNSGTAEGQLVYAGHGWTIKSKNIDAYEGLDVKDKIVVVSGNGTSPPPGVSINDIKAGTVGDWESPISYAQKHGAKALIIVPRNFERVWRYGLRSISRVSYQVERFQEEAEEGDEEEAEEAQEPSKLLMITPSAAMLDALFAAEQQGGAQILQASTSGQPGRGFQLSPSKRLRLTLSLKSMAASTQNVVAVLEGRDGALKKEYVAFGAHYDHVGANGGGCRPVNGDSICNGADDDGSGTTALLAMAEAFARGPRPKRSILFVWHAGEEKGLWGSQYFTEYPTVPLKQIVAQLNIDMIGRSKKEGDTKASNRMLTGPNEIYVIGSKMMSTELANLSETVNRSYLNLAYNYHYDEPNDPERLFYRSDHFNYARKGVPIIFFFDGVHEDYHQPSDSPDKIDYEKMEKVARTIFILGSELANNPRRPVIDRQIPAEQLER
jgi:hypothetical protein